MVVVAQAFNPSTHEAKAGGSLCFRVQPGLQELLPGQVPKATEKPCLNPLPPEENQQQQKKVLKTQSKTKGLRTVAIE